MSVEPKSGASRIVVSALHISPDRGNVIADMTLMVSLVSLWIPASGLRDQVKFESLARAPKSGIPETRVGLDRVASSGIRLRSVDGALWCACGGDGVS